MTERVVLLAGGVGGSRLAVPLAHALGPDDRLTVIANVGDDFEHFGLRICPDLDTLTYQLAGVGDPVQGWGIRNDTWTTMEQLERLGGPTWFRLGDRDLATHLYRTERLAAGATLDQVALEIGGALGLDPRVQVVPATCDQVRTFVHTEGAGRLGFQTYLVRRRAQDRVVGFAYAGAETAAASPAALAAVRTASRIVFAPSNPYVSIRPILAVPALAAAIRASPAPKLAVSPIIAGRAVKGPLAQMLLSLAGEASVRAWLAALNVALDAAWVDVADRGEEDAIKALVPHVVWMPLRLDGAAADAVARSLLAFGATRAGCRERPPAI
ncbi:MAG: 2-phospho-L-lactate transferase CofD family protein [Firmicutes bacterium]|nr:2-phospho-L-lactate transferase CofD family protein [Bacillota bacterium]